MERLLKAASDLKLSAFSNDLSVSFKSHYMRMCRIYFRLGMASGLEDITEEHAAYLREKLSEAEVEAADRATRRHEKVKWVSGAVVAMAKTARRLLPPFN